MKNKRGISLVVLIVAVVVMLIIVTSAVVIGAGSITKANFQEYQSSISRMSNLVNIYYTENNELPITGYVLDPKSISYDFVNEVNSRNDEFNKLYIVDTSKLKMTTIDIGSGTIEDKDIFVVSENTNNIYYVKGFKFEGKVVHGRYN